jgi:uncharacterized membrane protein YkoI
VKTTWIVGLLSAAALFGCGHATHQHLGVHAEGATQAEDDDDDDDEMDDDGDEEDEQERAIALADVPRAVLDAANAAVPGATWTSALIDTEGGVEVYELTGTAGGSEIEVEVDAAGKVLEIEHGDAA